MHELFQFGPGQPIRSLRGWRYNVGINGRNEMLTVAAVDTELPGLCGPDDLARWHMKLDFTDGTLETYGNKGQLHASDTSHPCINLLAYPENRTEWFRMTIVEDADVENEEEEPLENSGPSDNLRQEDVPESESDYEARSGLVSEPDCVNFWGSRWAAPKPDCGLVSEPDCGLVDESDSEYTLTDSDGSTSDESSHAHSSDEDFETSSDESSTPESIFEAYPTESEKFMTKGVRRMIRSNV